MRVCLFVLLLYNKQEKASGEGGLASRWGHLETLQDLPLHAIVFIGCHPVEHVDSIARIAKR